MSVVPKNKPIRDKKHLAWIRNLPCVITNKSPCDPAHIRISGNGGMGVKPDDSRVVPLTHGLHNEQHRVGEVTFWYEYGGHERAAVLARQLYEVSGDNIAGMRLIFEWRG